MPRRESRSGGARVTSSPRNAMFPEVARSSPESRFRNVDLPAPFGPMIAWIEPDSIRTETLSTAARAPKRRVRPSVASTVSGTRPPQKRRKSARQREHGGDGQRSDEGVPVHRPALGEVLDDGQGDGAERRAVQRSLASEQDRDEHEPRLLPSEEGGVHESVQGRVEDSREPGQAPGSHEGGNLVAARPVPEGPHATLVDADSAEHPAERRADRASEEQVDGDERRPDDEVRCESVAQIQDGPPKDREARPVRHVHSVGSPERGRLAEEVVKHLRECERDHDEVHAARAHGEKADDESRKPRPGERDGEGGERVDEPRAVGETRQQICAEAVERRMAESDDPRVADEQVEAHGEDAADHRRCRELHREPIPRQRNERERHRAGDEPDPDPSVAGHRARAGWPRRPRGRRSSTAAITAYTMALETPGKSTLPKVSAMPTSIAPAKAPLMEPIPPITTTTKETTRMPSPMPG